MAVYRCADPECKRPGMYMGEHPAKFWVMVMVELVLKVLGAIYYRLER